MSTCMPAPSGRTPAATCAICGAVALLVDPRDLKRPAINHKDPAPACECRCHEAWRFAHKKPAVLR